jgi:hypothetical protein
MPFGFVSFAGGVFHRVSQTRVILTVNNVNPKATYPPQIAVAAAVKVSTRIARAPRANPVAADQRGMGTTGGRRGMAVDARSDVDVEKRKAGRGGSSFACACTCVCVCSTIF